MRFTKKLVIHHSKGVTTYLFNGDVRRGNKEHSNGGFWSEVNDGLSFPCVLTDEQIWFILENLQMFSETRNYAIVVGNEQPVDLVLQGKHDLKFVCDDPGDMTVGVFPQITELRIQITPIDTALDDLDLIDFWRQAAADFCDVNIKQVYTASEFASEQEAIRKLETSTQDGE